MMVGVGMNGEREWHEQSRLEWCVYTVYINIRIMQGIDYNTIQVSVENCSRYIQVTECLCVFICIYVYQITKGKLQT